MMQDGLYASINDAPWDNQRWPDFILREIACKQGLCTHCRGEVYVDQHALDCLQKMRTILAKPMTLARGHSCVQHNREIGGAAKSAHLDLAFDIVLGSYDREAIVKAAQQAGFSHIGFMKYGLHVDTRMADAAAPMWSYGPTSRELWSIAWAKLGFNPHDIYDIGGI